MWERFSISRSEEFLIAGVKDGEKGVWKRFLLKILHSSSINARYFFSFCSLFWFCSALLASLQTKGFLSSKFLCLPFFNGYYFCFVWVINSHFCSPDSHIYTNGFFFVALPLVLHSYPNIFFRRVSCGFCSTLTPLFLLFCCCFSVIVFEYTQKYS